MNTFNKFLVVLMALMTVSFWVTAVLLVWLLPDALGSAMRSFSVLLRAHNLLFQAVITTFGVSSILVSLLILAGEFAEHEPAVIKLNTSSGGVAFVALDSLSQRLKSEVESIEQIQMVRLRVRPVRNQLDVLAEVAVAPDAHLTTKSEEVMAVVRAVATQRMGVPVKNVRVDIRHDKRTRSAPVIPTAAASDQSPGQQEILVPDSTPGDIASEDGQPSPRQ